jgi:tRNA splicing ligase
MFAADFLGLLLTQKMVAVFSSEKLVECYQNIQSQNSEDNIYKSLIYLKFLNKNIHSQTDILNRIIKRYNYFSVIRNYGGPLGL